MILSCASVLFAQGGARKALIIGNNAYSDNPNIAEPFPSLNQAPVKDANAIENALSSAGVLRENIKVLFDLRHDDFVQALYQFRAQLADQDAAVFYFSGHGFSIDGEDYLVPIGFHFSGTKAQAKADSIPLRQVLDILSKAPSRVVILDACRTAAPLLKSALSVTEAPSLGPIVLIQGTGSLVGYSTSGEMASSADSPGGGLSFFTYYLVKAFDNKPKDMLGALMEAQSLTSRSSANRQVPAIYNEMPYSTENGNYELFHQGGDGGSREVPASDMTQIRQLLTRYETAVNGKDVRQLKAIWPEIPPKEMEQYKVLPKGARIKLTVSTANLLDGNENAIVHCQQTYELDGKSRDDNVTFYVGRFNGGWIIQQIPSSN